MITRSMVLPPADASTGSVEKDLADVRVPYPIRVDVGEYSEIRPVGYYDSELRPGAGGPVPGPCNPAGAWGRNRHLFDALQTAEGDRYEPDSDDLAPSAFRLVLTCVRCGIVRELSGHLDASATDRTGGDRSRGRVDPVPLSSGPLLAQEVGRTHSWGEHWEVEWRVYHLGQPVGWIATELGRRGARHVIGALGTRYREGGGPVHSGASAIAVLRKLTRQHAAVEPVSA